MVDSESLGGAEVHLSTSGTAHRVVKKDEDALKLLRKVLSYLPANNVDNAPVMPKAETRRANGSRSQ